MVEVGANLKMIHIKKEEKDKKRSPPMPTSTIKLPNYSSIPNTHTHARARAHTHTHTHTHTNDPRHTTTPDMIHSAQTTLRPLRCHPMYPERGKSGPDLFAPLSRTATSTQRRAAQREGKSHVFLKGPAAEPAPTEKGVKTAEKISGPCRVHVMRHCPLAASGVARLTASRGQEGGRPSSPTV